MKIGILATGTTPDELRDEYGSYAEMFMRLFEAAGCPFEFETFEVREDEFPLSAEVCDGWIITGSKANVYQNLPWMVRLKRLIREIYDAGRPLVGICFGHQIVAETFGGRVDKYPGGWGVGLHSYRLTEEAPAFRARGSNFTLSAMHQDQVLTKPDNAEVLASSPFCRFAVLGYGDRILTLQAHPEFCVSFEEGLVRARRGSVIPEEAADRGLTSLRLPGAATDSLPVARWMAAFLRREAGSQPIADAC